MFEVPPSNANRYTNCSITCKKNHPKPPKICVICGNSFPYKHSQGKTCSKECNKMLVHNIAIKPRPSLLGDNNPSKRIDVRKKISLSKMGNKNPNWKPPVVVKCKICENLITTTPSKVKYGQTKYCSPECRRKATSNYMKLNNPMKRKDVAERVGKAWKQRWSTDAKFRENILRTRMRHPNKLEQEFTVFLEQQGLPFEFVGDFKFWIGPCISGKCRNPDYVHIRRKLKLAILISARYHHTRYKGQMTEELEDYASVGWKVLNIWEDDFRTNKNIILTRILNWAGLEAYVR